MKPTRPTTDNPNELKICNRCTHFWYDFIDSGREKWCKCKIYCGDGFLEDEKKMRCMDFEYIGPLFWNDNGREK